jgi:uncharacterized membrane protein YidH (DUF202 family)
MQMWEQVALGAIILVILLWRLPKVTKAMEQHRDEPKDWMSVLIPIGLVVIFVIVLIKLA